MTDFMGQKPVLHRDANHEVYFGGSYYFDEALTALIELDTLVLTAGATVSGNVTVTIDGTPVNIAVLNTDTTTTAVATKIRAGTFAGFTTGGAGGTVTFTATAAGKKGAIALAPAATGVVGTIVQTTKGRTGVNIDLSPTYMHRLNITKAGDAASLITIYDGTDESDATKIVAKIDGSVIESYEFGSHQPLGLFVLVTGTTSPKFTILYSSSITGG